MKPVAAIVGSGSLLGRELRDLLAGGAFQTKLIGADREETGTLTEEDNEPVVMTALDEDNLAGARIVFLAGSPESSRKALDIVSRLPSSPPVLIDLTYVMEDRPGAYLRAPIAEPANFVPPPLTGHVIAHPASTVLAMFLSRISQAHTIRRAVAHVFEPASERGKRGIEELEQQTVNLLTFKQLPKKVYGEQVGFNLLAAFGTEAEESLATIEERIERHLASLLALHGNIPMPSLRLIQAPVFHGYSASLWVEFEENPGREALEKHLASAQIDVRGPDLDPPHVVGMAGQSGIAVGAIAADRSDPRACWFWLASDNLRIMAENGVAVARALLGQPGTAREQ
ncbi:MAG TPA: Asd/ArgC dimerization domain-containing protein [Bryobacteraceae bacterium]|nr:Asd/ArgC dimerization domain-containing protein [Bryobacteraceae bacterium]HOL72664.1 Asd/ArgC dimerization domain-containing protein [Bryobacteraceae bacterium]HOQ44030.1 Asd/ArgC dimerization domain-containing protein [Bryobacteraceae bacterium]HPU70348.1 Asd/ArgC dimerization domain-containing protein [Bryobacteraceae bacterium]